MLQLRFARNKPMFSLQMKLATYLSGVAFPPAVLMIPAKGSAQANASYLWDELLSQRDVSGLLLVAHRHLARPSSPGQVLRNLGALKALLQLLGPRVALPQTCR